MPTINLKDIPVRIHSPFGDDALLLSKFVGTEALGRPFHYELTLASTEAELDYQKIVGEKITVYLDLGDADPRFFNGYVSSFAQTKFEGTLTSYRATVVPWLWFLTRSSNCRIFQNMTIPDIVMQVFQDFGFSDIVNRLHDTYRKRSYCVQYRETAFNFVSRLMEEEGIYYFFKHEDGKHSIVLCDSAASHRQFERYEEMLYLPESQNVREALTSWVVQREVQSGAFGTTNYDFTKPKAATAANSFHDRPYSQSSLAQFEHLGTQSPFDQYATGEANENERYSKLRLEELQARFETYSGEGDVRGVSTGACFKLKGHPVRAFETNYLTTGADYLIQCSPFETVDTYGKDFKFSARLTAVAQDTQFRTPRVTPKPVVHGPQTATVVGPSGQKIFTDPTGYGMVKVQFPWDRVGKNDENSSCFMRVSQSWAGKNWGDMAVPHVGDEVIVECLEGDPDRPIITGRVYNQNQMPPLDLPANNAKRVWQDDYGNRLVFDATPGDEHIRLFSPHHQSGITLGRSSASFTQSNDIKGVVGTQLNGVFGANLAHTFGLNLATTVGSNMAFNIGGNYTGNLAAQLTVNLGPQFTYTKGLDLSVADADFSKVVKGNALISADKDLSLIGGAGMDPPGLPTSAVMFAGESGIELSAGEAKATSSAAPTGTHLGLAIAAMAVPVVASLFMACTSSFVDAYSSTDSTDKQKDTALTGQKAMEGMGGTLEAISLVCLIATMFMGKKDATTTPALARHTSDWYSRLQVLTLADGGYQGKLETKQGGILLSHVGHATIVPPAAPAPNGKTSTMALVDAGITGEVGPGGKITLQTAAGSVVIDTAGAVTFKGTTFKVEAPSIDLGGAVTIMGTPAAPLPPSLATDVLALQAKDLALRAKLNAALSISQIKRVGAF